MKNKVVFYLAVASLAALVLNPQRTVFPAEVLAEASSSLEIAQKELMKVTEQGLVPSEIVLGQNDSSVFLLNMLPEEKLNLKVEFGAKTMHCHSKNLAWDSEKGEMKTSSPISPQDFAVLCFPQSGVYPISVEGVGNKKLKLSGTVRVGSDK